MTDGDLHQLADYMIGHGITCGDVLRVCCGEEGKAGLGKYPALFVTIAESIKRSPVSKD